ncbi:MAG: M23 family peptidase, partial [Azonexus sp.]
MQIILVSRHLKVARTITIMPRHLVIAGFAFLSLVMSSATLISWLTAHGSRPGSHDEVLSQQQETHQAQQFLNNNLQLMATRLGELQAQVLHLDTLGDRLAGIAGIKREAPPASKPVAGQG